MNIDRQLVARALDKAGEDPLTDEEFNNKAGTRWRTIYDYYLATILEALSNTEWTSQKKRARLELSEDENLSNYFCMYNLPIDCAKAVGLNNEEEYLIEQNNLYTDQEDAVLVYISNGYTGENKYEIAETQPTTQAEIESGIYYELNVETQKYQRSTQYVEGTVYYVVMDEDYPMYNDPQLDPMLSEYIETKLAAKIVLKLTGDHTKYQMLYNEAQLMENRAIKASVAHGHNKDHGNRWWHEQLGLPNYGETNYDDN